MSIVGLVLTFFLQIVIPEKRFNDEAFERLIQELNVKNTEGYEYMAESTNVTIYRKPSGVRSLPT